MDWMPLAFRKLNRAALSCNAPDFSGAGVRPLELLLGLPQVHHAGAAGPPASRPRP